MKPKLKMIAICSNLFTNLLPSLKELQQTGQYLLLVGKEPCSCLECYCETILKLSLYLLNATNSELLCLKT